MSWEWEGRKGYVKRDGWQRVWEGRGGWPAGGLVLAALSFR